MSKYATLLRWYVDEKAQDETLTVLEKCQKVQADIFEQYPIFDENHRSVLNAKILRHYYFYEIGFETVGLFKEFLNAKMLEIMPYYNKLYLSVIEDMPIFEDVDYFEKTTNKEFGKSFLNSKNMGRGQDDNENHFAGSLKTDFKGKEINKVKPKGTETKTTTDSGTETNTLLKTGEEHSTPGVTTTNVMSDTPQGSLSGVTNKNYLTSAQQQSFSGFDSVSFANRKDETTTEFNNRKHEEQLEFSADREDSTEKEYQNRYDEATTDNWTTNTLTSKNFNRSKSDSKNSKFGGGYRHVKGKTNNKSYAEILQEYRQSLINIDMMIINELQDLFMQIY